MNNKTLPRDHSLTSFSLDVTKNFPIPYVADKQLEAKVITPKVVVLNMLDEKNL